MTFVSHQRHLPIFSKMCPFFQSISIYIVKGGFIMNEVNQVTIIFTQIKHNSEGKVVEHKRRFLTLIRLFLMIKSNLFVPSLNVSVAKSMTKSRIVKTESLI